MRNPRRKRGTFGNDDADVAAGRSIPSAPNSSNTISSASDLDFFEDLVSEPVLVLGVDISHLSRSGQFVVCATGVFCFTLLYGYLQELLSVELCSRQLGLFLATFQFTGYTILSFILRTFVYRKSSRAKLTPKRSNASSGSFHSKIPVPLQLYMGLSLLRAVDLAMTNLAMQYINYPAKTLIKSSRVVFTMIFGVLITKKSYKFMDYFVVLCMVSGLAIFLHADANSSAVFQPLGVMMLTVSLLCDGAITNMSEKIMSQYGVGQDEFIFRMYSIALVAITSAAIMNGDMREGIIFMMKPGTYAEQQSNAPLGETSYSVISKWVIMIVFSSMGFFGSSCSAAITKNFGALAMSITSTARKATTLFLSFVLFNNTCTFEHIIGIFIFISALAAKSMRRKGKKDKDEPAGDKMSVELGSGDKLPVPSRVTPGISDSSDRSHLSRRERRKADGAGGSRSPSVRYHVV